MPWQLAMQVKPRNPRSTSSPSEPPAPPPPPPIAPWCFHHISPVVPWTPLYCQFIPSTVAPHFLICFPLFPTIVSSTPPLSPHLPSGFPHFQPFVSSLPPAVTLVPSFLLCCPLIPPPVSPIFPICFRLIPYLLSLHSHIVVSSFFLFSPLIPFCCPFTPPR